MMALSSEPCGGDVSLFSKMAKDFIRSLLTEAEAKHKEQMERVREAIKKGRYVGGGGEFSTGPGAIYADGWDSAYDKALAAFDAALKGEGV